MSNTWIYRVGLTVEEINKYLDANLSDEDIKNFLNQQLLKFKFLSIENALRGHIDETLGKPYKYYTSMRDEAPEIFSCSSLISYLYVFAGVWMPSLVIDKFFYFPQIDKKDLRFGDIVFSYNEDDHPLRTTSKDYLPNQLTTDKKVNHLGMYMGDGKILQASGNWYKGKVLIENLEESPSFKNIVSYGRVVPDLSEKKFVIEIPSDRIDMRSKEGLLIELKKLWQTNK